MNNRIFFAVFIPILIVEIVANASWIAISYDWRIRGNVGLSYTISIFAGALSGWAWCWMAQAIRQDHMFVANIMWDILVSIVFISLPILFYGIKLDIQTAIGTAIAVLGLLIMKA